MTVKYSIGVQNSNKKDTLQLNLKKMQQSMVKELDVLTRSAIMPNNRTSFITTAMYDGTDQLRGSRIQNLPNYSKQDLSGKTNFVIVFQGIEIQRLSVEVEALRVKLKDADRQLFNYKNYEVQIRELTEKCYSLEMQREQHLEQIEKMNMICQRLYNELDEMKTRYQDIDFTLKQKYQLQRNRNQELMNEIEKWKARYNALEMSKNQQLDDMRMMMESQRKSMISREIKELTTKYENQIANLQNDLNKLRDVIGNKDNQINKLRGIISQLEVKVSEARAFENQLADYENKMAMISQEMIRLNEKLKQKDEENQRLKRQEIGLRNNISEIQNKMPEFERLKGQCDSKQRQLDDVGRRYAQLQQKNRGYENEVRKAKQQERALNDITNEAQRLNNLVRDKMRQNDNLKNGYNQLARKLEEAEKVGNKVNDYENKLAKLSDQNQRVNDILRNKISDTENLKRNCQNMQNTINNLKGVEDDKKRLEQKIIEQVRGLQDAKDKIQRMHEDLRRMGDLENKLRDAQRKKNQFNNEMDRLNNTIRNSKEDNEKLRKVCMNYENELRNFNNVQLQLDQLKKKLAYMTRQIDRINGVIFEKLKEISKLREDYQKVQANSNHYKEIERKLANNVHELQSLISKLDNSRRQNDQLQEKNMQLEGLLNRAKNDLFAVSQEKQSMTRNLNEKNQQLEQCKRDINAFEGQMRKFQDLNDKHKNLQRKTDTLENNFKELQRRYGDERKRNGNLNNQLQKTAFELNKLKNQGTFTPAFLNDYRSLKSQVQQQEQIIAQLNQRIQVIGRIIKAIKEKSARQQQFSVINEEKWMTTGKSLEQINAFVNKMVETQKQMYKISEENMKLQSNLRIMSVQLEGSRLKNANPAESIIYDKTQNRRKQSGSGAGLTGSGAGSSSFSKSKAWDYDSSQSYANSKDPFLGQSGSSKYQSGIGSSGSNSNLYDSNYQSSQYSTQKTPYQSSYESNPYQHTTTTYKTNKDGVETTTVRTTKTSGRQEQNPRRSGTNKMYSPTYGH